MFKSRNHLLRTTLLLGASVLMAISPLSASASRRHHIRYHHHRRISRIVRHKRTRRTRRNRRKSHIRWRHHRLYYVAYSAQNVRRHKAKRHYRRPRVKYNRRRARRHTVRRHHVRKTRTHKAYKPVNNIYGYDLGNHPDYISPHTARLINNVWTPNNNEIENMEGEINLRSLNDVNNDRTAHNLNPVTDSVELNDLATMRSQQIQTNFNHYDSQGQPYVYLDGKALGMNPTTAYDVGENIASGSLGTNNEDGDPTPYYNTNADQIADMEDNSMVNHDQVCDNGHRNNTLNPYAKSIGIADSYNPASHSFYLAEEYSGDALN